MLQYIRTQKNNIRINNLLQNMLIPYKISYKI